MSNAPAAPSYLRVLHRSRLSPSDCQRTVLIGGRYDIAQAMEHPALGGTLEIVGAVELLPDQYEVSEATIQQLVSTQTANSLLIVGTIPSSLLITLGELAVVLGCRLMSLVQATRGTGLEPTIVREAGHPLVEVSIAPNRFRFDRRKRCMDIILASFALLVMSPVIAMAALLIRLESRGNPVFGHVRIGRGGRRFRCWKLRTMHADAELRLQLERDLLARYRANDFKLPDDEDPRVTRMGRLLRKTSLDELPQLWNVLAGEMSLVGPRPIVAEELRHYRGEVLTLLSVRPGITGAWAVSGRHHLSYPQRAAVELAYVRSRSALKDLSILLRTVGAVFDPGFGLRDEDRNDNLCDAANAVHATEDN